MQYIIVYYIFTLISQFFLIEFFYRLKIRIYFTKNNLSQYFISHIQQGYTMIIHVISHRGDKRMNHVKRHCNAVNRMKCMQSVIIHCSIMHE